MVIIDERAKKFHSELSLEDLGINMDTAKDVIEQNGEGFTDVYLPIVNTDAITDLFRFEIDDESERMSEDIGYDIHDTVDTQINAFLRYDIPHKKIFIIIEVKIKNETGTYRYDPYGGGILFHEVLLDCNERDYLLHSIMRILAENY